MPLKGRASRITAKCLVCSAFLVIAGPLCAVEALYRKAITEIGEMPEPPQADPTTLMASALWAAVESTRRFDVEPQWPWRVVGGYATAVYGGQLTSRPRGFSVALIVARTWLSNEQRRPRGMFRWHLEYFGMTLWVTRHWTGGEMVRAVAETSHFGRGATGVRAAALAYFGKSDRELNVAQAALIASRVRNLSRDPLCDPTSALRGRSWVLGQMERTGAITGEARRAAERAPLNVIERPNLVCR